LLHISSEIKTTLGEVAHKVFTVYKVEEETIKKVQVKLNERDAS
jgi:hypothetical protein